MIIIGDQRAVFGIPPELPVHVGPMVMRYKIRARSKEFCRIYLFIASQLNPLTPYHVEEWYLGNDGKRLFPWIKKGENRRA